MIQPGSDNVTNSIMENPFPWRSNCKAPTRRTHHRVPDDAVDAIVTNYIRFWHGGRGEVPVVPSGYALVHAARRGDEADLLMILLYLSRSLATTPSPIEQSKSKIRKIAINCNFRDEAGMTAMHYAAFNSQKSIIHLLLEHGADSSLQCLHGTTALHKATSNYDEYIASLLLSTYKESRMNKKVFVNLQNCNGDSALHFAAGSASNRVNRKRRRRQVTSGEEADSLCYSQSISRKENITQNNSR